MVFAMALGSRCPVTVLLPVLYQVVKGAREQTAHNLHVEVLHTLNVVGGNVTSKLTACAAIRMSARYLRLRLLNHAARPSKAPARARLTTLLVAFG
jgi:hypothetical protein